MTMLRRTLSETVWYPAHPPRTASALYTKTHHELVYIEDRPCVVCGVRNSTLGSPLALAVGAKALETHHDLIEWAGQNEIDYDKLAADHPDLTTLGALAGAYHAHLNANSGRFEGVLDPAILTAFIDSTDQLIVACDAHHRSSGKGIHSITGPVWNLQRYERGDWDFVGGGAKVGGWVLNGPTNLIVGESGPEYIIPNGGGAKP